MFSLSSKLLTFYFFLDHQSVSSVTQLCLTLRPHGLQHARLPCPSWTPGAYSNSCPSSWWCHPTISSSVISFFSCLQSCPASGSFPKSQFFLSGGQSIGVSASASVLPMNIQDWFPLGLTGLIYLQSKGLLIVFSCEDIVKAMVFPVVMYGCESWTIKKPECGRIDAFELWCWRRLLRVPWAARKSNQSILKEVSLEYSLEGHVEAETPILWPPDAKSWLIEKDPDARKD